MFPPLLPTLEGYEENWVNREGETESGRERERKRDRERIKEKTRFWTRYSQYR